MLFRSTYDEIEALEQVECVQCDWRGLADETYDVEGQMVCPECREPVEFVNVDEMDIEDALEELKQEFEMLMAQEEMPKFPDGVSELDVLESFSKFEKEETLKKGK